MDLILIWARKKEATPAQFSLSWLLVQKFFIVLIPGTTNLNHLEEDIGALKLEFSEVELKEFREEFSKIELVGVRERNSVYEDQ